MDDFDDDGLDDLNDTVLQELENNAIQFTQARQLGQTQAEAPRPRPTLSPPTENRPPAPGLPPPAPGPTVYDFSGFQDDDLDDTIVIDELAQEPAPAADPVVDRPLPPQQSRVVPGVDQPRPTWQQQQQVRPPGLASQHLPSRPVPQAPPSQRHHAGWQPPPQGRHLPPQSQFNRRPPPPPPINRPAPPHHGQQSQATRAPGGAGNQTEIIAALQAQLATLQSELTSAKGEAAIVRSKYEKFQTGHEAEIARLKRLNAEQLAKQERAMEAALAAEKNATTELQFARQDLKEELGRAKVVKKKDDLTSTPKKKNKTWAVADGFDDVEILPSPGKGQGKRRGDPGPVAVPLAERTPTKGKRKRPAFDSPVMALEVHSEDMLMPDAPEASKGRRQDTDRIYGRARHRVDEGLPFDFLKLVLDHSPAHGQPLTFDLFSRYAFPSNPSQSLAAIMLDKLPDLGKSLDGSPHDPLRLLVDFSELLLVLWTQCNEEKYYAPIYDVVSLLSYTLQLNTMAVVPHLISNLLPLIQTTCLLITIPRTESESGDLSTHPNRSLRQMALEINVTQLLSLLYLAALGCMGPSPSGDAPDQTDGDDTPLHAQKQFWRHVQLEFVLMLFDKNHPEEDFLGVLSLLCTSVLPGSIGPIYNPSLSLLPPDFDRPNDQTPEFVARSLIDRVSRQLSEPPAWAPRRSVKECRVRLAVLRTLLAFATSPFGALQLAASASLIPRLVLVLCWSIDSLYDMDVPQSILKWKQPMRDKKDQMDGDKSMTERGDDSGPQNGDPDATQELTDANGDGADAPQPQEAGNVHLSTIDEETLASQTRSTDKTLLLNQIIAQITALLHFLVTDPRTSNAANMPAKLAASHGGSHRYLITLARLAFAEEDLVLEAGISARTVELAHDLLELAVTPDEGEGVGEVFGP